MNAKRLSSAIVGAAIMFAGCARDKDFAVVEPSLSRQYQSTPAASAVPQSRVVGVQQVAGQVGVVQPVYQAQNISPIPGSTPIAATPPASSTGGVVPADPSGQPYYAPPPISAPGTMSPSAVPYPAPIVSGVQPSVPVSNPRVGAGTFPVAPGGMWAATNGNQQIAIHQFGTPTTGSSFVPSAPMDGGTASSLQSSEGVVPAGATVPFVSAIPPNAPPPQNTRMTFLSDTRENEQPSRIRPQEAARPVEVVPTRPAPSIEGIGRPLPKIPPAEEPQPLEPPRTKRMEQPPVGNEDDLAEPSGPSSKKTSDPKEAPSASPPRTSPSKSAPSKEPLKKIDFPSDDKKNSELSEPLVPKRSPPPTSKKQSKDDGPGKDLDDLPLPPKAGSGI